MLNTTISEIRKVEEDAAELLLNARQQVVKIKKQAEIDAKKILQDAEEGIRKRKEETMKRVSIECDDQNKISEASTEEEVQNYISKAMRHEQKVIDSLVKELLHFS